MTSQEQVTQLRAKQVLGGPQMGLSVRKHRLRGSIETYDHDFVLLVIVCSGGGKHHTTAGGRLLKRGDVFVLRPGLWHAYDHCKNMVLYNCCLAMDLLERQLGWLRNDPMLNTLLLGSFEGQGKSAGAGRVPSRIAGASGGTGGTGGASGGGIVSFRLSERVTGQCEQYLEKLNRLEKNLVAERQVDRLGYLLLLLGELQRHRPVGKQSPAPSPQHYHHAVIDGIALIEQYFDRDWTLSELAKKLYVAKSYLVRLFKAQTGLSPMAYLARYRSERAAAFLLRTNLSMTQIAQKTGWPDPNYFARRFKTHFGVSPSAYRTRHAHTADQV